MNNKAKKNDYIIIENSGKNNRNNRIFIIGAICVAVLIVGLIVGNIIVGLNHNSGENQPEDEGSSEETVIEIDKTEEDQDSEEPPLTKENFREKINVKILGLEDKQDVNAIYEIYQEIANGVIDNELKVEIYKDCVNTILGIDLDREYGDLIISTVTEIDDIEQTVASAAQAYNYASAYKNEAAMNKFNNLMVERSGGNDSIDSDDFRG